MYQFRHWNIEFDKPQYPTYAYYDGHFTSLELQEIEMLFDTHHSQKGTISQSYPKIADAEVRNSKVGWHYINNDTQWLLRKISYIVNQLNDTFYKMDLNSFEPFQLTEYNSNEKQFYDWHVDNTSDFKYNITRKLSCILFLTEPQAYEGGKFQYKVGIDDQEIDQPRGRVVVFPSYTLHRVTPVTRGIRRSVVTWVSGPPFK